MANRENGLPRPSPGTRGVKNPEMPAEKTAAWPGAPGPKGPKMNRVGGFHEVKVSAKQDMADDIYGNGPATIGQPVPPVMMSQPIGAGIPVPSVQPPPIGGGDVGIQPFPGSVSSIPRPMPVPAFRGGGIGMTVPPDLYSTLQAGGKTRRDNRALKGKR